MLETLDTSHSPITPCGPNDTRVGDTLRLFLVALLSSSFDKNMKPMHVVCDIDPEEPKNICSLLAFEYTQAAVQNLCSKDLARKNILSILITFVTSHFEMSVLNDVAAWNILDISVTRDTSHLEMSQSNDVALKNMLDIVVAPDTCHLEISPLNSVA